MNSGQESLTAIVAAIAAVVWTAILVTWSQAMLYDQEEEEKK